MTLPPLNCATHISRNCLSSCRSLLLFPTDSDTNITWLEFFLHLPLVQIGKMFYGFQFFFFCCESFYSARRQEGSRTFKYLCKVNLPTRQGYDANGNFPFSINFVDICWRNCWRLFLINGKTLDFHFRFDT